MLAANASSSRLQFADDDRGSGSIAIQETSPRKSCECFVKRHAEAQCVNAFDRTKHPHAVTDQKSDRSVGEGSFGPEDRRAGAEILDNRVHFAASGE